MENTISAGVSNSKIDASHNIDPSPVKGPAQQFKRVFAKPEEPKIVEEVPEYKKIQSKIKKRAEEKAKKNISPIKPPERRSSGVSDDTERAGGEMTRSQKMRKKARDFRRAAKA